jgi:hypothetical protein
MSSLEIAISYYNNMNFFDLLNHFDKQLFGTFQVTIYNKSDNSLDFLMNSMDNVTINNVENRGREGETYLRHIIENYDDLTDYTLFIQDDTDNHIPNETDFIQKTMDVISNRKEIYYPFKTTWRKEIPVVVTRIIRNGILRGVDTMKDIYSIKKACDHLKILVPPIYFTETCAFFLIHKNIIRKRPVEFYITVRDWLLENEANGFTLELLWILIFS